MTTQVEFVGYKPGAGQKVMDSGPVDVGSGVDFVFGVDDVGAGVGSFFLTEPNQDGVQMTATIDGAHRQQGLLSLHWAFPSDLVLKAGRHIVHVDVDGPTQLNGKLLIQGKKTR